MCRLESPHGGAIGLYSYVVHCKFIVAGYMFVPGPSPALTCFALPTLAMIAALEKGQPETAARKFAPKMGAQGRQSQ